jgi:hypothetical protein
MASGKYFVEHFFNIKFPAKKSSSYTEGGVGGQTGGAIGLSLIFCFFWIKPKERRERKLISPILIAFDRLRLTLLLDLMCTYFVMYILKT